MTMRPLSALVALSFTLTACSSGGEDDVSSPTPWDKPARVNGADVRFTYDGSECQDGDEVEIVEGSRRVVISVREVIRREECNDAGVLYDVDVQLDAPLGHRKLVDGACSNPDFTYFQECDPSEVSAKPRR